MRTRGTGLGGRTVGAIGFAVAVLGLPPVPAGASVRSEAPRRQGGWECGAYDQSAKRGRQPEPDALGKIYPLVTIHGITGSDRDFDMTIDKSYIGARPEPPRSLTDALAGVSPGPPDGLPSVKVFSFSYTPDSLRWVDDARVGGEFAKTIDCLFAKYGSPVSVLAHSMGGLVTRWVANTNDDQGVSRASKLGQVVTLGTPYAGSDLSALANGVTDAAGRADPSFAIVNYLCGRAGTATGQASCGNIPLYASFRSEAGRNLVPGSAALTSLKRWPAGVDVAALAGDERIAFNLFGSPLKGAVSIGDIAVSARSATDDPGASRIFVCSYDGATSTATTSLKEVLGIADPVERRAKLSGAFTASPCFHSNLMGYVELTNEVLGQFNDWAVARRQAAAEAAAANERRPVVVPSDTTALESLISSVPDLAPGDSSPGCESLDLLALDLASRSLTAFHSYEGDSPCSGDPFEVYLVVRNGVVVDSSSCAEADQSGECDRHATVRGEWSGRTVTSIGISSCNKPPAGVCIDSVSQRVRP